MRVVDCQGFAGAFSLGAIQAGFSLVAKLENTGGFGMPVVKANPALYGTPWTHAGKPSTWPPIECELLVGNPPCSGFSSNNRGSDRGEGAAVNQCMRDFWAYAAACRPQVAVMESVPQAHRQGGGLMRSLVAGLCDATGLPYRLTHCLQNSLSVGGAQNRPRYFLVASLAPFTAMPPAIPAVPSFLDAVGDLAGLPLAWPAQEPGSPTWYSAASQDAWIWPDGNQVQETPHAARCAALVKGTPWRPGENLYSVLRRYHAMHGRLPDEWDYQTKGPDGKEISKAELLVAEDFGAGKPVFAKWVGWDPSRPARVVVGATPTEAFNVLTQRMMTFRECARLMGFPDSLRIEPLAGITGMPTWWGKQTSVAPARWICAAAAHAIEGGDAGDRLAGTTDEHGDMVIDITDAWKQAWNPQAAAERTAAAGFSFA